MESYTLNFETLTVLISENSTVIKHMEYEMCRTSYAICSAKTIGLGKTCILLLLCIQYIQVFTVFDCDLTLLTSDTGQLMYTNNFSFLARSLITLVGLQMLSLHLKKSICVMEGPYPNLVVHSIHKLLRHSTV